MRRSDPRSATSSDRAACRDAFSDEAPDHCRRANVVAARSKAWARTANYRSPKRPRAPAAVRCRGEGKSRFPARSARGRNTRDRSRANASCAGGEHRLAASLIHDTRRLVHQARLRPDPMLIRLDQTASRQIVLSIDRTGLLAVQVTAVTSERNQELNKSRPLPEVAAQLGYVYARIPHSGDESNESINFQGVHQILPSHPAQTPACAKLTRQGLRPRYLVTRQPLDPWTCPQMPRQA
jgi:hypothetical protein